MVMRSAGESRPSERASAAEVETLAMAMVSSARLSGRGEFGGLRKARRRILGVGRRERDGCVEGAEQAFPWCRRRRG